MKVIVPYRADNGHRDRLWAFLRTHYWAGFDITIGHHHDGPFNRAKAVNRAAQGDWDVAVIADADTWVPHDQLDQAVQTAQLTGCLTTAFTMVAELTKQCTRTILFTQSLTACTDIGKVRDGELDTQSSIIVVTRDLWDRIGGMDERFNGWGGEDNAFWKAAHLHSKTPIRIPGYAYHLWHPPAPDKHRGHTYQSNLQLWRQYQTANTIEELP